MCFSLLLFRKKYDDGVPRSSLGPLGGSGGHVSPPASTYDDSLLHRGRVVPPFASDPFSDLALPQADGAPPTAGASLLLLNDGRGVETGLDSTTYF